MRRNAPPSPDETGSRERAEAAAYRTGPLPAAWRMEELDAILARLAPTGREAVVPPGDLMRELAADLARKARLSGHVEALGRRVAELHRERSGHGDLAVLKDSLENLCSILSRNAAQSPGDVPVLLRELTERIEGLAERAAVRPADPSPVLSELERLHQRMSALEALAARLTAGLPKVSETPSTTLEALVAHVERLDENLRRVARLADTSTVELMLRTIGEKLERRQLPDLAVIESRIEDLAERCAHAWQEPVRALAAETAGHLESLRGEARTIAETAARMVAGEPQPGAARESPAQRRATPGGDLSAVTESLIELKALHLRSDKKIQKTLQGLHDALKGGVARSPAKPETRPSDRSESAALPVDRLQAAIRRLQAAAVAQVDAVAADRPQTPLARDIHAASDPPATAVPEGNPRPLRNAAATPSETPGRFGASFSPPSDEAVSLRASFIAAARRATQSVVSPDDGPGRAAGADQEDGSPPDDDSEHDAERLIDRLKRTLDTHKRPLAYVWAALLIGCAATPLAPDAARAQGRLETPSTDRGAEAADSQLPFTPGALCATDGSSPIHRSRFLVRRIPSLDYH